MSCNGALEELAECLRPFSKGMGDGRKKTLEKEQKIESNVLKVELFLVIEVWGVPFFFFFAYSLPVTHF